MRAYSGVKKVLNFNTLPDDYDAPDIEDNRVEEMEESAKLLNAFADYLKYDMIDNRKNYRTGAKLIL
jgi:hypothetical protein